MRTQLFLILLFVLAHCAFAQSSPPRPLPASCIGRVGAADLRLLAPAHLKQAAAQMSYETQRYKEAAAAFRYDLKNNPESKFSYLALCQLDSAFRQQEYDHWKDRLVTLPAELFRKGVALYMYHQFKMLDGALSDRKLYSSALLDQTNGPLAIFDSLWRKEPDVINGILLAAIKRDLSLKRAESDRKLLQGLIYASAGSESAERYEAAKESGWRSAIPEVKSLSRPMAALLAAAISNDMSQAGTYVLHGKSGFGYGLDGNPVARLSAQTGAYTFLEGTEARFLYDWRQRIYDTFNLP